MSVGKIALGIFALGVALVTLIECNQNPIANNSRASGNVSAASTVAASPSGTMQVSDGLSWRYSNEIDEMSGVKISSAQLSSTDSFIDSMGMREAATTTLEIQQKGKNHYVAISNPNLQFTCSPFTETFVRVKFDNGPPHAYPCTDEKTSKYGVAFILNAPRFIASLRKAKHVVIEAEVFQRGMQIMHWDVPTLNIR